MYIFSFFIQVGVLWFLITLYSGSHNSSASLRETWIVIIGVAIVSMLSRMLLGGVIGPLAGLVSLAALYVLVDKVCGLSRRNTIKICVWYLAVMILVRIVGSVLSTPV